MIDPQYCSHMPAVRQREEFTNAIPRTDPNWEIGIRELCKNCGRVLFQHITKAEPDPCKWGGKDQYSETAVESFSPEPPK